MRSLSRLEMGLTGACFCLVVALMVALYWLFWWMKRAISRGLLEVCRKPGRDILLRFLYSKKNRASSPPSSTAADPCEICSSVFITVDRHEESTSGGEEEEEEEESVVAAEENCWGPPWVLFTIREETEEEMKAAAAAAEEEEEESSTGRRRTSLADSVVVEGIWPENPVGSPPKSAAPPPLKLKSLKVSEKTFLVPFHPPPPPPVAAASSELNESFLTIIVE